MFSETAANFPSETQHDSMGLRPRIAGGHARYAKTPKSATEARAIELFWQAAEELPRTAELPEPKVPVPNAKKDARGSDNEARERYSSLRRHAVRISTRAVARAAHYHAITCVLARRSRPAMMS
jgi:hypothetical protein